MLKGSFPPIVPSQPSVLILGSLPGDLSLEKQQYYAHPQNRFWKILFEIFNRSYSLSYHDRVELLHRHHIALWDICQQAERKGSMDINISQVIPNPITAFLANHRSINTVIFNGQKAQKLFEKHFNKPQNIQFITLPSTSPANAQFSFETLVSLWTIIKK